MKRVFLPQDFLWFLIPVGLAGVLVFLHFFIFSQTWTKKGIRFIKQKKPQSAVNLFVKILEREPFHPYAHLNLGLAYDMRDRPMKALKEYGMILKYFNQDSLQFFASFNRAELHGRLGNLEKALENYQQALAFSIEKDKIKQNIELLFQAFSPQREGKRGKKEGPRSQGQSEEGKEGGENRNTPREGKSGHKRSSDSFGEGKQDVREDESQEDRSSSKDPGEAHAKQEQGQSSEDSGGALSEQQDRSQAKGDSTPAGEISKTQAQSIMDEIEEQESNVRARQFQQNSLRQPRRRTDKDW